MRLRKPLKHQAKLLKRAAGLYRLALLWEMRLGKCLATLRWLKQAGCRSALIVSPSSVLPNWTEEILLENLPTRNLRERPLPLSGSTYTPPRRFCCINYELLRVRAQWLAYGWDAIVLDESVAIRNPTSKTSKILTLGTKHIPYRAVLTGEIMPESLLDIFQQFKFLYGEFMGHRNYYSWRDATHQTVYTDWDWMPMKGMRDLILQEVKRLSFRLTRKQAGVGGGKVYQTRYIDLPAKARTAYRNAIKDFEFRGRETKWRIVVDNWLAQISGGEHKDAELIRLLKGELAHKPVVVWFRYNPELYRIYQKLTNLGIKATAISGKVAINDRKRIADKFNKGKYQVVLMQLKCGKYGVNLSGADTAIYFSCSYEGDLRSQSLDRIIHHTKTWDCLIIDLVTKDTIDEDIREALMEKRASSRGVLMKSIKKALARELAA